MGNIALANLDDPLWQELYASGRDLLGSWDETQEAARKDKALGGLKQTLAERAARGGLTGSSQEYSTLAGAAKDFELDWSERKAKEQRSNIASVLPISNFLSNLNTTQANLTGYMPATGAPTAATSHWAEGEQLARDLAAKQGSMQDASILAGVLSSIGLPQWIAQMLFGSSNPAAGGGGVMGSLLGNLLGGGGSGGGAGGGSGGGLGGGLVNQGVSALYKWLTGGGSTGTAAFPTEVLDLLDPAVDWTTAQAWVDNWLNTQGIAGLGGEAGGLSPAALDALDPAIDWAAVESWLAGGGAEAALFNSMFGGELAGAFGSGGLAEIGGGLSGALASGGGAGGAGAGAGAAGLSLGGLAGLLAPFAIGGLVMAMGPGKGENVRREFRANEMTNVLRQHPELIPDFLDWANREYQYIQSRQLAGMHVPGYSNNEYTRSEIPHKQYLTEGIGIAEITEALKRLGHTPTEVPFLTAAGQPMDWNWLAQTMDLYK